MTVPSDWESTTPTDEVAPRTISRRRLITGLAALGAAGVLGVSVRLGDRLLPEAPPVGAADAGGRTFDALTAEARRRRIDLDALAELGRAARDADPSLSDEGDRLLDEAPADVRWLSARIVDDAEAGRLVDLGGWLLPRSAAAISTAFA